MTDNGAATPVSLWTDSVFLSTNSVLTSAAVLLGRVAALRCASHWRQLPGNADSPVTGLLPGPYFVLVESDSGGQAPDVNRANNVLASTTTVTEDFKTLQLGGSAPGTIAAGQDEFFEVDLPAGQDVQISVSTGDQNAPDLYVGYQSVPTESNFLEAAVALNQSQRTALLTSTQAGAVLHSARGCAGGRQRKFHSDGPAVGFQYYRHKPEFRSRSVARCFKLECRCHRSTALLMAPQSRSR